MTGVPLPHRDTAAPDFSSSEKNLQRGSVTTKHWFDPARMRSWVAPQPRWILVAILVALAIACTGPSEAEISRDRAIEIARGRISFQPDTSEATRTTSNDRPVWRVTFRGRLPGQPPGLFETAVVDVDRSNGEIVSVART
jgi:hypothetical protein